MFSDLLKRPFPKEKVKFRAGATDARRHGGKAQNAIALAYIDARDVQDRLDEVVGSQYWETEYQEVNGITICRLTINFPGFGKVTKCDGAGATDVEGEKGQLSDAFKRAGVHFGIGRYLYDFPNTWYPYDGYKFQTKEFKFPQGATEKEWRLKISRSIDKEKMQEYLIGFLTAIKDEDDMMLKQLNDEMNEEEQGYIWRLHSHKQQQVIREMLKCTS